MEPSRHPRCGRTSAYQHTMISRLPGNPENDGRLSPWQEAAGHKNRRGNEATTGLTLGLFVMLFRDVVLG